MCINRDNNVNIDDIDEKYDGSKSSNKFFINLKNKFKEMFKKVRKAKKKNKK